MNSHISLNKVWIISTMEGGRVVEREECKLLSLAVDRIQPPPFLPHSTWTTFSPPDTHQHGKHTSCHTFTAGTRAEKAQHLGMWSVNELYHYYHWLGWFCETWSVFYLNGPTFSPPADITVDSMADDSEEIIWKGSMWYFRSFPVQAAHRCANDGNFSRLTPRSGRMAPNTRYFAWIMLAFSKPLA